VFPSAAPDFLRQAGLTNKGGFVPVDIQSNRLLAASGGGGGGGGGGASGGGAGAGAEGVFALGDCCHAIMPKVCLLHICLSHTVVLNGYWRAADV
jgi:hypothetical protein